MSSGATVELVVERLAAGGDGVARDARGRAVFVPGTAPGDRVRARLVDERKRFARAELVELIAPGPDRVEPRCPLVGTCGGCTWQHLRYQAQCQAKAALLEDALVRIGGVKPPGPVVCTPSPAPFGYRTRARMGFDGGRIGFRRLRSHALCPTDRCPVLAPALQEELAALWAAPPSGQGELTLAAGDDGSVSVTGDGRPGAPIVILAGEERVRVSPGSFFQANAGLRGPLAEAVAEASGSGARALELFAGSGFFTLGLARRFDRVRAVESHPAATRDLRENLAAANLDNVEVRTGRAELDLAGEPLRAFAPEVVVLDPPRTGLPPGTARPLAALGAHRLVYVSCDPATLARDARALSEQGYALAALRAFDLFPQTPHVEALATLTR